VFITKSCIKNNVISAKAGICDGNGTGFGLARPCWKSLSYYSLARNCSSFYSPCGLQEITAMALMDFIKKQFIDILEWQEDSDGTLAWRFPMAGNEIQYGGSLTVRESQMAVFINEGKVADVFGPGRYTLTTSTLPVLTYLQNWDKLFQSPFKSDVVFFSTRQQIDQRWGTTQPVTIRDKDFGAVRLRAFGNYSYRVTDPKKFFTEISGTRERYTVEDLDGQLRALMLQHISDAVAGSGLAFLDLAANQVEFAQQLKTATAPSFEKIGLALEGVTVQNLSLPEELQKILDQKIGMGMVGNDMGKFMQYQTAQSMPKFAEGAGGGGGGVVGDAMGLGAGVALGQVMAQQLSHGLQGAQPGAAAAAAAPVGVRPDEVMATLEKLADLKTKGILTAEEFDAKKAELLKKLV
jgi:membrane protease subunit (stomatin/prohibitin family)